MKNLLSKLFAALAASLILNNHDIAALSLVMAPALAPRRAYAVRGGGKPLGGMSNDDLDFSRSVRSAKSYRNNYNGSFGG